LKLAILVPQYFYQHRKISLPGIGTFSLDDKVTIPEGDDKNIRDFQQHIQFKEANIPKADDALIEFIRAHTGKIRPLAESDLESYVADGKLMLNIGKPFHIEGIGTLIKNRNGVLEFTAGLPTTERLESVTPVREREMAGKGKEKAAAKKSVFDEDYYPHDGGGVGSRRLIIFGGIILGLAVVIWGGYSLYNKKVEPASSISQNNILAPDTAQQSAQNDSLARAKVIADSIQAANNVAPGSYKFIFETTYSKSRALRRHLQVSDISPRIKMESNADSTQFNIYVVLPGLPSDTTRLKDSLNAWYYGSRPLKVTIAH
jgi:hypothetical protein